MTTRDPDEAARAAWASMSDLVLDNERRHEVSDAVGLPFSRVRAIKRIAVKPMTLGELARALTVDPPNCTPIVDDLVERGLVERQANPADRRSTLVVATAAGHRVAKKVKQLWERPPAALLELSPDELGALADLLARVQERTP
jgi:DNA-binding MarR family transcriptional regulator